MLRFIINVVWKITHKYLSDLPINKVHQKDFNKVFYIARSQNLNTQTTKSSWIHAWKQKWENNKTIVFSRFINFRPSAQNFEKKVNIFRSSSGPKNLETRREQVRDDNFFQKKNEQYFYMPIIWEILRLPEKIYIKADAHFLASLSKVHGIQNCHKIIQRVQWQ